MKIIIDEKLIDNTMKFHDLSGNEKYFKQYINKYICIYI